MTQKVTKIWYGQKLGSALMGIILWPICILVGIYFLWGNEFSFISREKAILKGENIVTQWDISNPNNSQDGFVHLVWEIIGSPIIENNFWIEIPGVKVASIVERYQWTETSTTQEEENFGWSTTQTTTYDYKTMWSSIAHDSSTFHDSVGHENPSDDWKYTSQTLISDDITFGSYILSQRLIENYLPTPESFSLPNELAESFSTGTHLSGNAIYIGEDPTQPNIGDYRIKFSYLPSGTTLSMLVEKLGNTLWEFRLDDSSQNLTLVSVGNHSSSEMFATHRSNNSMITWIKRAWFTLLIFIGFQLFFSIVPTLASVIPFFGRILGFGVWLIAFLGTLIIAGWTIAIAWLAARPLISLGIIVLIVGVFFLIKKLRNQPSTH